jgi:thiosulfate/3-mercaptopyruvate sulfurtransferase
VYSLHVGDKTAYAAQHIKGARAVTMGDLSVSGEEAGGLNLQMLPVPVLHDRLAALGISNTSRIVVYSANPNVTSATRVVLTLDYAGLGDRASLLDGGMAAWTKDGRELTNVVPEVKPGTLAPLTIKPIIVDAAFVKANLKTANMAIVDARLAPFYDGTQIGGSPQAPHKTGHIEGAHNVPWSDLTTDSQTFKPAAELKDRFAQAGVKPGDTVVGYCHIGQQATAMIFAARTLGFKVLLYDGSFEDGRSSRTRRCRSSRSERGAHEIPAALGVPGLVCARCGAGRSRRARRRRSNPQTPRRIRTPRLKAGRRCRRAVRGDRRAALTSTSTASRSGPPSAAARIAAQSADGEMSPVDVVMKFDEHGTSSRASARACSCFRTGSCRSRRQCLGDGRSGQLSHASEGSRSVTPLPPPPAKPIGHQVFKFSPTASC